MLDSQKKIPNNFEKLEKLEELNLFCFVDENLLEKALDGENVVIDEVDFSALAELPSLKRLSIHELRQEILKSYLSN
ncbi:MAG: hypothetical protein HZR80_18250 [Candidatus Heimdallarchaeota archaeon]